MSIPHTREIYELVQLFSPTAAQARRIDAELTPTYARVGVDMRGHLFSISIIKANSKPYGYCIDDSLSQTFADFGELKEAVRVQAEAIIEKEGAEK